MKREVVPTSPQYKGQDKKKPALRIQYKLSLVDLIILLFVSIIGGVCGSIIIDSYLGNKINIRDAIAKNIVYLQDERQTQSQTLLSEALSKIQPSVVSIFIKKSSNSYLASESLGSGLIITSDGWLVALDTSINETAASDLAVISNTNKSYSVDKIIYDKYSGIVFMKIKADNLTPAQFADLDNLDIGDDVAVVFNSIYSGQRSVKSYLENISFHDENEFNTTEHAFDYLIADTLRKEYKGAPLINMKGEVIGLNILDNRIVPHKYFTDIMPRVISQQNASRIDINFVYSDLSRQINGNEHDLENGVLVNKVITPGIDIKINDIIIKIDNQEIDKFHNITDILHTYNKGDLANFTIIRQHKEKNIEIEL